MLATISSYFFDFYHVKCWSQILLFEYFWIQAKLLSNVFQEFLVLGFQNILYKGLYRIHDHTLLTSYTPSNFALEFKDNILRFSNMALDAYESGEEQYEEEYYDDVTDDDYFEEDDSLYTPPQDEFRSFLPTVNWRRVKLGQVTLEISDNGRVKPKDSLFGATKGYPLLGTPYLTYPVELEQGVRKEFFVHDLVWWAFNGPPPEGWEVRHTYEEASKRRKYYSNDLRALSISPITVEVRPTLPIPI